MDVRYVHEQTFYVARLLLAQQQLAPEDEESDEWSQSAPSLVIMFTNRSEEDSSTAHGTSVCRAASPPSYCP